MKFFRLNGLLKERFTRPNSRCGNNFLTPCKMIIFCILIWIAAFLIISPIVFHVKGRIDFGEFGYNPVGFCNIVPVELSGAGLVFSIGFSVPCILINISSVTLSCVLKHRSHSTRNVLGSFSTSKLSIKYSSFFCLYIFI